MISVVLERYKKIRNFNHLQFKTTFKMAYLHCITLLVIIVSVSVSTAGTCLSTYHFDSIIRELTIKLTLLCPMATMSINLFNYFIYVRRLTRNVQTVLQTITC